MSIRIARHAAGELASQGAGRSASRIKIRRLNAQAEVFPERLAFAFDIDGVLKQGKYVLPQAKRVLKMLTGQSGRFPRPIPFLCVTNGGGITESERLRALSKEFGIELGPDQLVQSHTPLQDYVSEYANEPVLVVGGNGEASRRVAESYGLTKAYILQDLVAWRPSIWDRYHLSSHEESLVKRDVDFSKLSFKAIFVIHDNGMDWGFATQVITELLMSENGTLGTRRKGKDGKGIPLILTNPDVIWGSDYPLPRLGMGAFRIGLGAVYKTLTGEELPYTQFGKPHATTYTFAEKMLRRHMKGLGRDPEGPLSVYMVGDNPESDIAGANGHGWRSILVGTGVYRGGKPSHTPSTIVDDVEQGVEWAIKQEQARYR